VESRLPPSPLGVFCAWVCVVVFAEGFVWFCLRSCVRILHESFEFCESDYFVEVEAECVEDLVEC
jgi:hypothetical protein